MKYKINRDPLRAKIEAEKMTHEEAAARIGISASTLSDIMITGRCTGMNLGKIAKFVGLPAWQIVI